MPNPPATFDGSATRDPTAGLTLWKTRLASPRLAGALVALVFVLLAARLLRLTYRYAVNIFFWDQWAFHNADVFQKHSLWQMFRWQFGPHRLGVGPLLAILIEPHFQWNARVESFLACGIVILAAACAVWLKTRLSDEISIWDIAIPIVYLAATQYEVLFINTDLAHGPLPLLLITLYCLAWTIGGLSVKYLVVLALNFLTIYTGFGLFLGFLTPALLIFDYRVNLKNRRKGTLYFAAALLIAGASLASFFLGYALQPAVTCFSLKPQKPLQYFRYVSLMFANLWIKGIGVLPTLIGCAVVLWLLWGLISAARKSLNAATGSWPTQAMPAILISYSLLFSLNTAVGRLCLGPGSAQSSRYIDYLVLGILGLYLHLLSVKGPMRRVLLGAALAILLATLPIRRDDRGLMRYFSQIKRNWRDCYLSGGTIATCDQLAGYKIDPEPERVLQQKLDYLKRSRQNLYSPSK